MVENVLIAMHIMEGLQSAVGSVRIRGRSGDSTDYYFRDFDGGCWYESCVSKIRSTGPVTRAEGILCWSCIGLA
jgi:hypothetical protein